MIFVLVTYNLQEKFPLPNRPAFSLVDKGIGKLFEHWTVNGGLFWRSVGMILYESSLVAGNPKFIADRTEMMGAPFRPDLYIKGRPEAAAHIRAGLHLLETTFLADGRFLDLG